MKPILKTVFALFFTFLTVWNVSGLPVYLLHKGHSQDFATAKISDHSSQKIIKVGFSGDHCQCAMHIDANHFSFPINFTSFSVYNGKLFLELPPGLVLRDGKVILSLSGSRAPPALS